MLAYFFNGILPIFSIGALGFFFGKKGDFDFSMAMAINKFVMLAAVPALIITFMADVPINKFNFELLGGYFLTEILLYLAAISIARFVFKLAIKEAFLIGATIALTNHILYVLPIAHQLYSQEIIVPIISIITMDGILLFSISILIMDVLSSKGKAWTHTLLRILSNPPVLSIILGLIISLLQIKLPIGLELFLNSLGNTASPALLFALGIILSQTKFRLNEPIVWVMTAMKLIVHPTLAFFLFTNFIYVSSEDLQSVILVAAAPCGIMGFMLAINYNVRTEVIALAILYTSIGSLVTLTIATAV